MTYSVSGPDVTNDPTRIGQHADEYLLGVFAVSGKPEVLGLVQDDAKADAARLEYYVRTGDASVLTNEQRLEHFIVTGDASVLTDEQAKRLADSMRQILGTVNRFAAEESRTVIVALAGVTAVNFADSIVDFLTNRTDPSAPNGNTAPVN